MITRRFAVFGLLSTFGGCSLLPSSGPNASVVDPGGLPPGRGYQVVDLDYEVAGILERLSGPSLADGFGSRPPPPSQRLGVGDTVQVTVFEAGPGGLFTPQTESAFTGGGRQTTIPAHTIDRDGRITVPYAGHVQAAGRTPKEVANDIQRRLSGRALEPQVIVSLVTNASTTASVLGEVTSGGKIPLSIRGERVLDVIAAAGGIKAAEHEVIIRIIRGDRTASSTLRTIISRPSENVYIQPQDTILVIKDRPTFVSLGAVGRQGTNPIPSSDYTLSEAIGSAGGLNDNRADQSGVFLFRFERPEVVYALGSRVDTRTLGWEEPVKVKAARGRLNPNFVYPVVYRIRLSEPSSFLSMSRVKIKNRDIIYVANAPSAELEKFLGLVGQTFGVIRGPLAVSAVFN